MPFDGVFNIADDQRHLLLEESKPQRVGNSNLFCGRFFARASGAMEQICSRLRAVPRYSPFFLVRHAPELFSLCVVGIFFGIPLFYFLSRKQR